jgi:hypothetical protein
MAAGEVGTLPPYLIHGNSWQVDSAKFTLTEF